MYKTLPLYVLRLIRNTKEFNQGTKRQLYTYYMISYVWSPKYAVGIPMNVCNIKRIKLVLKPRTLWLWIPDDVIKNIRPTDPPRDSHEF